MKLDTQAQKERLKRANNNAGLRYNRDINLEIKNIKRNLQALNREPEYLAELFKLTYKAKKELLFFRTGHPDKTEELKQLHKNVKSVIDKLLSLKTKSNNENISWSILTKKLKIAIKLSNDLYWFFRDLQDKERQEKGEYAKTSIEAGPTWSLYAVLRNLLDFINNGVKIKLFTIPRMILKGEAGIGKTHLLCDYANNRINSGKPTLIFLSDELASIEDTNPVVCMAKLMGYTTSADFLKDLRSLANSSPERVCLIIDAINEADAIKWSQLSELFNIKGLSLVISVRNGYERMIPNRRKYSTVEHFGFSEMEWDATSTFFKHYKMKMPEIPIINPEFRNPLFLMIFCEAYKGETDKTFKGKGATHVFEQYVIEQSKKIVKELNIKLDNKNYLWWNVIKQIGIWMGQNKTSVISRYNILRIIETDPKLSSRASELLKLMEKYGLLLKYPRYGKNSKRIEYKYKFTYNRFSDHLIVRSLLTENKINSEVSAQRFFADGKFLDENINNIGLLEALSIQIPERCKKDKAEFVWVIPEKYRDDYRIKTAFLNSIKWRDVELDGFDKKTGKASYINESQIRKYISTYMNDSIYDLYEVMDCLFDVSVVPNHPLNAMRLHEILSGTNLAERDSWFQQYMLNATSEQGNAISRIQSWSISRLPRDISDQKAILLTGIALAWTLSSTENNLRDRSTRALIQLFRYHQDVLVKLLEIFINVDDPYIVERLFAATYGVVSLNPHDKAGFQSLVLWIYKNHFLNKSRRPDALLDDYAKGLIELYIRKYKNNIHVDLNKIKPPFTYYKFPNDIPDIDSLRREYDNNNYCLIWRSLMYGEGGAALADFGNYTVNFYLSEFTNIPLSKNLLSPNTSRKDFNRFMKSLSKKQKKLLEEYDSKKLSNRLSFNLIKSTAIKQKISDDEVSRALNDFEKSLSSSKKREYKKYKLYVVGEKTFTKAFEDYDINIARRWIMDRVIKLGWRPELHEEYDRDRGSFDRLQNSSVERIGKKYQWMALYEFLAMIGSNYYYVQDRWLDDTPATFKSAYQTSARDLDPTVDPLLLEKFTHKNDDEKDIWWKPSYSAWRTENWQFSSEDIPRPKTIIESKHSNNTFITLLNWAIWKSERENPEDEDDRRYRELWIRTQGYVVYKKDLQTIIRWSKDKRFYNDTLPQPADHSRSVFLSEFPNSSAYQDTIAIYEPSDGWITPDKQTPFKVIQPVIQYSGGGFENDRALRNTGIRIYSPNLAIRKLLSIQDTDNLGIYKSKDKNICMFNPDLDKYLSSDSLLVNKNKFIEELERKSLTIIWSVLGEKLYHNNGNYTKQRLEVQGICYLDDNGEIIEDVRYEVR